MLASYVFSYRPPLGKAVRKLTRMMVRQDVVLEKKEEERVGGGDHNYTSSHDTSQQPLQSVCLVTAQQFQKKYLIQVLGDNSKILKTFNDSFLFFHDPRGINYCDKFDT
ncbi:hypothetical protein RRG08_046813 [Elysia crispata]|uniref:Uncharacterized protein n=1 Tax=Elysia crispata TaxID=231223 RepID=A0AAE0ZPJ2_9GAST|nr:hypothetical protein RRG08_046813 [Elysia crispata]